MKKSEKTGNKKLGKTGIFKRLLIGTGIFFLVIFILFGGLVAIGGEQAKSLRQVADADTLPAEDIPASLEEDTIEVSDAKVSEENVNLFDGETIWRIIRFNDASVTVCDTKSTYTISFAGVQMTPAAMRYVQSLLNSKRVVIRLSREDDSAGYLYALDGTMVQEDLIYRGLCEVDSSFSEHLADFLTLQEGAQVAKVGIWAN